MLIVLICVAIACYIAGFVINGFTLYSVLLILPTIMFAARKVGIHIRMSNIITCEVIFVIFSLVWRLIFHKFALARFILSIVVRLIFIAVVVYDDTAYVYVSEERKKI